MTGRELYESEEQRQWSKDHGEPHPPWGTLGYEEQQMWESTAKAINDDRST